MKNQISGNNQILQIEAKYTEFIYFCKQRIPLFAEKSKYRMWQKNAINDDTWNIDNSSNMSKRNKKWSLRITQ